jgi:hypothetical protein
MKCPKCKYVTFDYLDACPRCGKNMVSEKAKYNISGIRPNPPFVLGSLTGDIEDSGGGLDLAESMNETAGGMGYENEAVYDDGSDLDINIDEGAMTDAEEVAEIDLGDLGMTDDTGVDVDFIADAEDDEQKQKPQADAEDLDLDLSDVEMSLDFEDDEGSKK